MPPDPDALPLAARNLQAAHRLLEALVQGGLGMVVVAPGSRSAPLAQAAALLEGPRLRLLTAIDERSAGFLALGWAKASGCAAAVVTTSGTAVANLLPAAVEADWGTVPLLLLTADRPERLKNCGANQTVNQQQFLVPSLRWLGASDPAGLAAMEPAALRDLAHQAMAHCAQSPQSAAGPVHLNLAFEEPLHGTEHQWQVLAGRNDAGPGPTETTETTVAAAEAGALAEPVLLDPDQTGVVVAGPWRGTPQHWRGHLQALERWLQRSGWPLLADGLSGLRGQGNGQALAGYDLLLDTPESLAAPAQVLRLGPLPASRRLQNWLAAAGGRQLLISEGESRRLDPLGTASSQWSHGLDAWINALPQALWQGQPQTTNRALARSWQTADRAVQQLLDQQLTPAGPANEPALARALSRLLPVGLPLVLANSSPVRDWESFAASDARPRPVIGFRGASGIDGTLSSACGVAEALGEAVLLTGDLALLHDSNGWLWRPQLRSRLTVVLVNNGGGGIFEQLPIRHREGGMDFERLFAMPQSVDVALLCTAHGVPHRHLKQLQDLAEALAWARPQPLAVIEVHSDRQADAALRQRLRTMASELVATR